MGVFKEMLADDRRVLVGLYISIRSWIYDGDKLFNDLKTRQAILKSILFCTGNQCNNLRSSLESCLRSFLNTSLAALFWIFLQSFQEIKWYTCIKTIAIVKSTGHKRMNEHIYELYLYLLSHVSSLYIFQLKVTRLSDLFNMAFHGEIRIEINPQVPNNIGAWDWNFLTGTVKMV